MPKLTFQKTQRTFDVPAGTKLLEFCEDHPGHVDFGCQVGSCGTCIQQVVAGAEHLNAPSKDELETLEMCTDVPGARLGCQLEIRGDCTLKPL